MKNKSLAYLDIKSLFTDMPVDKRIKRLKNHLKKIILFLPVFKLIKILNLFTSDFYFQYNNHFNK